MSNSLIQRVLKEFDYFGVQINFSYMSREKYRTAIGGIGFIIFLIVSLFYTVINLLPLLKRQKMSVIYYKTQLSETDAINLRNYSTNFAVGVSSCVKLENYADFWEYFSLEINHVTLKLVNGKSEKVRVPMEIGLCEEADLNNQFDSSFDSLGLKNYYCLKNTNFTIEGTYVSPLYKYIEIKIKAKDKTNSTFNIIREILKEECDVNMYIIDSAFDLSNYTSPMKYFLVSQYINIKYTELMKRNSFVQVQNFKSYTNYIFDNYHSQETIKTGSVDLYSVFKGEDRFTSEPTEFDTFAKIYLRAELSRVIVERRYMKLTEFIASTSSILSAILIIMFIVIRYINKFYANESVMRKIFQFNNRYNSIGVNFRVGKKKKPVVLNDLIRKTFQFNFDEIEANTSNIFHKTPPETEEEKDKKKESALAITQGFPTKKKFSELKDLNFQNSRISDDHSGSFCFHTPQNNNYFHKSKVFHKRGSIIEKNESKKIHFHFNICELMIIKLCPCLSWKSLGIKSFLLGKAKEKLFFQLDVLNYLKKMQLIDLLGYTFLSPEENTILQFLSKPSISLAQRTDIYDKINTLNNVGMKEVDELYNAIRHLYENKNKSEMQKRLFSLTKSEMGMWIKRIQEL